MPHTSPVIHRPHREVKGSNSWSLSTQQGWLVLTKKLSTFSSNKTHLSEPKCTHYWCPDWYQIGKILWFLNSVFSIVLKTDLDKKKKNCANLAQNVPHLACLVELSLVWFGEFIAVVDLQGSWTFINTGSSGAEQVVRFGSKVVKIEPNGTNSGVFRSNFITLIFGFSDLKIFGFVPFIANLNEFRPKFDIFVWEWDQANNPVSGLRNRSRLRGNRDKRRWPVNYYRTVGS